MISQGQLFPFEELKEKDIYAYSQIEKGSGSGKTNIMNDKSWELDTKNISSDSHITEKHSKNVSKSKVESDFIDDPHLDYGDKLCDFFEDVGIKIVNDDVENFDNKDSSTRKGNRAHCDRDRDRLRTRERIHQQAVPFWVDNPNVLFYPRHVHEFFPVESMHYNQKLNAVSRLIILLTLVGFLFVRNLRIIWIGAICLLAIFLIYYTQNRNASFGSGVIEGFDEKLESLGVDAPAQAVINAFATDDPSKIGTREFFDAPKTNNPYNNVLITDIVDNPDKLPAPPAYYPSTEKEILDKTKEAIQKMNPTFPGMTDKLFASLDDHFEFEQSARQFYSNPATTIPNDQGAFAAFCYGEMVSCKEGNMFACARDAPRHNLY